MISWTIDTRKEKGPAWYMIAWVLILAIVIWGAITGLYFMSIAAILFAGVYILIENNAPEKVDVHIHDQGIEAAGTLYDFGKIESFTIIYEANIAILLRLSLRTKSLRTIDIDIPQQVNIAELRETLATFIQEDSKGELTLTEKLLRKMKV